MTEYRIYHLPKEKEGKWSCGYGTCKKKAVYLYHKITEEELFSSGRCEFCGEREIRKRNLKVATILR